MQLLIRSTVCPSVREADGSGCAAKNAVMSSRDAASQNEPSAFMSPESPPKIVTLPSRFDQCRLRKAHVRGRAASCARNRERNPEVSWLRSFDVSAYSSARSMSAGSRNRASACKYR